MVMVVGKICTGMPKNKDKSRLTGWGLFVFEAVYIPCLCFGCPSAYFALHHPHHGDCFLQKAYKCHIYEVNSIQGNFNIL